jgi:hypothetical protein
MVDNKLILIGYLIYMPLAIALTIYVSRTLFANGKHFMLAIFHGEETIALATNRLFEMGFYLLNIGFALYTVKMYGIQGTQDLVETLAVKVGAFSVYLGVVLFLNLYLFLRGRKNARKGEAPVVA